MAFNRLWLRVILQKILLFVQTHYCQDTYFPFQPLIPSIDLDPNRQSVATMTLPVELVCLPFTVLGHLEAANRDGIHNIIK
jgi:hypothetical protein